MERWRDEHPILARFHVCNVKIHGIGMKMHDGMSWHGTSKVAPILRTPTTDARKDGIIPKNRRNVIWHSTHHSSN